MADAVEELGEPEAETGKKGSPGVIEKRRIFLMRHCSDSIHDLSFPSEQGAMVQKEARHSAPGR